MGTYELHHFGSAQNLAVAAAEAWLRLCQDKPESRLCVALAGGRIAGTFFSATAQLPDAPELLQGVQFFWGDERSVPPDSPESNYRLACEKLLDPLGMPREHIHRIQGELAPELAASQAEADLRKLARVNPEGTPVLDLVFLGMGEDGHVASLFPGESEEAMASHAVYRAVTASKPPPQRITLGYPALTVAQEVWVLVSGTGKAGALQASVQTPSRTPLGRVLACRSHTRILTDIAIRSHS